MTQKSPTNEDASDVIVIWFRDAGITYLQDERFQLLTSCYTTVFHCKNFDNLPIQIRPIFDDFSNHFRRNFELSFDELQVGLRRTMLKFPCFFNKRPMRCNSTSSNYTRQTCRTLISVWSRHWAVVTVHTLLVAAIPVGSTWSASSFWHLQSPSSEITQGHSKQRRRATHHTGKWSWLHGHALCPNRILRTACSDGALLPSFSPLEKVPSLCVSGQCRCGWRACWHYRPWNPRCYCGSKCGLGCKSQRLVHRRWKWAAKHTQQECHDLFKFEEMCSELGEWSFVTNCWDLHDRHEQQHCGKPHCGLWKRNLDPGILPWVWTRQCLWQGVSPILSLWWVAWQHLSWLQQIWLVLRSSISTQGQDRWRWLSCWQGQLQVVHPGRRWQWCCEWGSRWSELA